MKPVRIGCSGWNYSDWRELVYPKGMAQSRWLEHYATLFDTVEVNATFYRLPKRDTVAGWVERTPDDFVFTIKASRYLTHVKRLRELPGHVERLLDPLEPLLDSPKMGPLLWQLPANFHRDDDRLADAIDAFPELRNCIEFRHPSWFCDEVLDLLQAHGVALVFGDHPERPFQTLEPTADWVFVRLHYGSRGRRGNYSETELEEWADRIDGWRRRRAVYVYLNNDWEGFAVRNAAWLQKRFPSASAG
jgi:uncharacterized protein YecE (DUF72 family)